MLSLNRLSCVIVLISISIIFSNCKKQIAEQSSTELSSSLFISANDCKPTSLGVLVEYPDGTKFWRTLMEKWYDQNGRLEYLKAGFYHSNEDFQYLHTEIRWAHITYHNNNQVYLTEGSSNDYRMRVTLDAQQRPAASYYFRDGGPRGPMGNFIKDTSYYYFTGNRLDSTISLYVNNYGGRPIFFKHKYHYDVYGNLVEIRVNGFLFQQITYDYTQPVADMLTFPGSTGVPSIPYRLMEYMDLLHFPVHHRITGYNDYKVLDNGLVFSYSFSSYNKRTFYTGWQCGNIPNATEALNRQQNSPASMEEFLLRYPAPKK